MSESRHCVHLYVSKTPYLHVACNVHLGAQCVLYFHTHIVFNIFEDARFQHYIRFVIRRIYKTEAYV